MIRATLVTTLLLCSTAFAGEKALMHCFAYTAIETATPADWEAFHKATDDLPKQIKTVKHVWYGKLQDNLFVFRTDAPTNQKFRDGAKSATGEFTRLPRQYGVCMELTGPEPLKAYSEAPYHKDWEAAYSKVRVPGTTTFNIIGQ